MNTDNARTTRGIGMDITYTTIDSALGWLLVAATKRGLCAVRFGASAAALEQTLRREFPGATTLRDDAALRRWSDAMLGYLDGRQTRLDLPLDGAGHGIPMARL